MKIALRGSTFTKVACYSSWGDIGILEMLDFKSIGSACCMWKLSG